MKKLGINFHIRDIVWINLSIFLKLFFNLISSIVMARLAGAEYFGKFQYVFSLNGLGDLILMPGIKSALINSAARKTEGDFIIAGGKRIKLFPFCFAFFIFISISTYLLNRNIDMSVSFLIIGFFTSLISLFDYYLQYYLGRQEYKTLFKWDALIAISSILAALTYFIGKNMLKLSYVPLSIIIFLPLAWQLVCYFIMSIKVKKRIVKHNSFSDDFQSYSKNLSLITIVMTLQSNLDKFIIGTFFDFKSLAFYSIGKKFYESLTYERTFLFQYLQPRFVRMKMNDCFRYFKNYLILCSGLILFFAVLWFFISGLVISLFGKEFLGATIFVKLFLIVFILNMINSYIEPLFRAKQFYKDLYWSRTIYGLTLISLIFFIYLFGSVGIIYNNILATCLVDIAMTYLFFKKLGHPELK